MGTVVPFLPREERLRPLTALECEQRLDEGHPALCQFIYQGRVMAATDPAFIAAVMKTIDSDRAARERRRSFHVVRAS
ncbi:MAG: hypothetical protein ACLP9C_13695 [Acidimicrobiales bacterium]